jgi:hypothetical protein
MKVITVNAFSSGEVLYHGQSGWVDDLQLAEIFTETDALDVALMAAEKATHQVVGAYAIEVSIKDGAVTPVQYREVIRASGPTNYRHGKAAEGVKGHVSI